MPITISQFIKQYGTRTASLMIRRYADTLSGANSLRELADDLEKALENYAAEDVDGHP